MSFHLTAGTPVARRSLLNPLSAVASFPGGIMHNTVVWNNSTSPISDIKLCFPVVFHWKHKHFFSLVFIKVVLLYYWLYDVTWYFETTVCSFLLKTGNQNQPYNILKKDGLIIFLRKKGQFAVLNMLTLSTETVSRMNMNTPWPKICFMNIISRTQRGAVLVISSQSYPKQPQNLFFISTFSL